MREYDFTVHLRGLGDTPEDAWQDICQFVRFQSAEDYDMPMTYRDLGEWDQDTE